MIHLLIITKIKLQLLLTLLFPHRLDYVQVKYSTHRNKKPQKKNVIFYLESTKKIREKEQFNIITGIIVEC